MTQILLVRHGSTDWNVEGRLQGQTDVPLNSRGLEQAAETAARLPEATIAAIYTSDLRRASQTAEVIGARLGLAPKPEPRLREICMGEWEGKLVAEHRQDPNGSDLRSFRYPAVDAPPGGETSSDFQQRLVDAIRDICAGNASETVLVVTHGYAVAVLRAYFEHKPLGQAWNLIPKNGEVYEIVISSKKDMTGYKDKRIQG